MEIASINHIDILTTPHYSIYHRYTFPFIQPGRFYMTHHLPIQEPPCKHITSDSPAFQGDYPKNKKKGRQKYRQKLVYM